MALDKLVDSTQLDSDLTSVANAIRAKSGGSGQLAFPAGFVSEIGNISGGLAPPVNAVAQFPIEITFASRPGSISIDFTSIIGKLTNNRAYSWSFILWRNDIVSSTSGTYIASDIHGQGRIASTVFGLTMLRTNQTISNSMTSAISYYGDININGGGSFSSNVATLTLKDNTDIASTDLTGKWKGIFTVMPPWKDEYTGTKVTTCPAGFISYTPYS